MPHPVGVVGRAVGRIQVTRWDVPQGLRVSTMDRAAQLVCIIHDPIAMCRVGIEEQASFGYFHHPLMPDLWHIFLHES